VRIRGRFPLNFLGAGSTEGGTPLRTNDIGTAIVVATAAAALIVVPGRLHGVHPRVLAAETAPRSVTIDYPPNRFSRPRSPRRPSSGTMQPRRQTVGQSSSVLPMALRLLSLSPADLLRRSEQSTRGAPRRRMNCRSSLQSRRRRTRGPRIPRPGRGSGSTRSRGRLRW
jgi:hypothetical protein